MHPKQHSLKLVYINPRKGTANLSVILLHGLGGNASDLSPIADIWQLQPGMRPRWVFPQAPARPVTINAGQVMPAWYDILSIDAEHKIDLSSVQLTVTQLLSVIEQELSQGIAPNRILLAGFSQGGAIAIETMFQCPKALAGVICLSGYVLNRKRVAEQEISVHAKTTPIFYAHGEIDTVVPFELAKLSCEFLRNQQFNVTWRSYPTLGHFVNNREILEVKKWIDDTVFKDAF